MWGEILALVIVVSVVAALIGRRGSGRGGADSVAEQGGSPGVGPWIAADPLESAFPVERTPRERDVGDAAFVDGFVVGRYIAPADRATTWRAGGDRTVEGPGGDEGPEDDSVVWCDDWPDDGSVEADDDASSGAVGDPVDDPLNDVWDDW